MAENGNNLAALLRSEYHMSQGGGFDTLLRTGRQAAALIETQAAELERAGVVLTAREEG